MIVVTDFSDPETEAVASRCGAEVFRTFAFTQDGAKFNKGRAIAEAYDAACPGGSVLFFDADIVPPANWRDSTKDWPGFVFGAKRRQVGGPKDGKVLPDAEPAGYFLLFNSQDTQASIRPIVDTHFYHAGCYDTTFLRRWPNPKRKFLDLVVQHHGPDGENWCGRGNTEDMKSLLAARRDGKKWQTETIGLSDSCNG
jgi:hypothetical protein